MLFDGRELTQNGLVYHQELPRAPECGKDAKSANDACSRKVQQKQRCMQKIGGVIGLTARS